MEANYKEALRIITQKHINMDYLIKNGSYAGYMKIMDCVLNWQKCPEKRLTEQEYDIVISAIESLGFNLK